MPVQESEMVFCRPATVGEGNDNGGRMSAETITSGVNGNVRPDLSQEERETGSDIYRKLFIHVRNADSLGLLDTRIHLKRPTPAGDRVLLFSGTQTDTQGSVAPSRYYGAGTLNADLSAGTTSVVVNVEAAADTIFQESDRIILVSLDGDENITLQEEAVIAASGVAWSGDQATLTLSSALSQGFLAADTYVASVIEVGSIKASADAMAISSASGSYDDTANPVEVDGIATVEHTVTLTFSDDTNFTASSDVYGSLGSGTTTADFAPDNGDFSRPYLTIRAAGWGGTRANGDTFAVTTHPAAYAVWERFITPANVGSLAGNGTWLRCHGASE